MLQGHSTVSATKEVTAALWVTGHCGIVGRRSATAAHSWPHNNYAGGGSGSSSQWHRNIKDTLMVSLSHYSTEPHTA